MIITHEKLKYKKVLKRDITVTTIRGLAKSHHIASIQAQIEREMNNMSSIVGTIAFRSQRALNQKNERR